MLLNSNERICIYSYNETEFLNIQEYLLNNGFNWELFKNNALYDTNKKVISPITPNVLFNFDYNNDFLFNYLVCDFMNIFEKHTKKFEYKKYNARDILLLEKINKIRCSKSVRM